MLDKVLVVTNIKRFALRFVLLLVLCSLLVSIPELKIAKAESTIYIRADGSVEGTTDISTVDNVTYTFTDNIYDYIVVERDNIVVDGASYALQGTWSGWGIDLSARINVTIRNVEIRDFSLGICIGGGAKNNKVSGNNITESSTGIWIYGSSNNSIHGNNITNNDSGVSVMFYSDNNMVSGNNIANNGFGVSVMLSSGNNTVSGNNITESPQCSIIIFDSSNNSIHGNNITNNPPESIRLDNSSNNIISGNIIMTYDGELITLNSSSNNTISGNNIANGLFGIWLDGYSKNNVISGNNITESSTGIIIVDSSNNSIHGNNFIGNYDQVNTYNSLNAWDAGYPSGGNYWSHLSGTDLFSGPYQNVTGCDGISDTPYIISSGNQDRYPLIFPKDSPPTSPAAKFFVLPDSIQKRAGELVTFEASSSLPGWNGTHAMPIKEYHWDFGDGNTTSTVGSMVFHTYSQAKTYKVTLTVLDSRGWNSSCFQTVEVWMPTFISISTSSSSTFVGFAVDINGTLHDIYENGLRNQTVILYYTFSGADTWVPITSDTTDNLGHYSVEWIPPATGYFTIKAEWAGNTTHYTASNNVTLSSTPYENRYVFSIESNSTISGLAFNTTSQELTFNASGPSDTKGYVKVTIAKSLVDDITNIKVYLDGNQTEYSIESMNDSWLLTFHYSHSSHRIVIELNPNRVPATTLLGLDWWLWAIILVVIVGALTAAAFRLRRRKQPIPTAPARKHAN